MNINKDNNARTFTMPPINNNGRSHRIFLNSIERPNTQQKSWLLNSDLRRDIALLEKTVKKGMRELKGLYERDFSMEFPSKPKALPLSNPEQITDFETISDDDYRSAVLYLGSLGGHTLIETCNEILKNALKDAVCYMPQLPEIGIIPNRLGRNSRMPSSMRSGVQNSAIEIVSTEGKPAGGPKKTVIPEWITMREADNQITWLWMKIRNGRSRINAPLPDHLADVYCPRAPQLRTIQEYSLVPHPIGCFGVPRAVDKAVRGIVRNTHTQKQRGTLRREERDVLCVLLLLRYSRSFGQYNSTACCSVAATSLTLVRPRQQHY
ncbi:uncharacterized protein [Venturia canescens]|uniref:uncharacterized protein n=1 Tax=Venturia canescens TaxID=32260 RepID=UPI001C9C5AC4|nr:uncharacterized protein LOC122407936 [Venturia canescens]